MQKIINKAVNFKDIIIDTQTPVGQNDKIIYISQGTGHKNKPGNVAYTKFINAYYQPYQNLEDTEKNKFRKGAFVHFTEHGYKFCKIERENGQDVYKQIKKEKYLLKIHNSIHYIIKKI
jgi:hypothetical protein